MFYNETNETNEKQDNNEVLDSIEETVVNETENLENELGETDKVEADTSSEDTVISSDNKDIEEEPQISNSMSLNYLNPEILDIKSYTQEEIDEINIIHDTDNFKDEDVYKTNFSEVNEKQVVTGTVESINEKGVLVDIGFKSEGVIDRSEFKELPSVGDEIETFIVCFEDKRGRLILSKERADFEKRWDELRTAHTDESVIKGKIIKRIKGGMVVDLGVVNAFLPGSQVDVKAVTDFDEFIGNDYDFKIVKFNEFRQNIVVSRKATLASHDKNRQEMMEKISVGDIMEGVVKNITDFGAFIDLGGIDGLLHITDITWGRINHPKEKLSIGENLSVKIIDFDQKKQRISLGMKQLTGDPWDNALDKFTINSTVNGKIVNIMNYGIFLEIEEGIEGLVHISEISWTKHIKHPSDMYKVGDRLDAMVLSVDIDQKKISLGVKQLIDNPWNDIEDKYSVDDVCDGKIVNIVQNGVYVEIDAGVEGFLHNTEMSWTRKIKDPNDIFNINDKIKVKIIEVSVENKKIHLGYKQLFDNKWLNIEDFIKVDDTFDAKVQHQFDKGLIILLPNDFEALLPQSKLKNSSTYKSGDKISVIVNEVDVETQKIILSSSDLDSSENSESLESEENIAVEESDQIYKSVSENSDEETSSQTEDSEDNTEK